MDGGYHYYKVLIEEELIEFHYHKHSRPKNKPIKSIWLAPVFKIRKMMFSKSGYLPKKKSELLKNQNNVLEETNVYKNASMLRG